MKISNLLSMPRTNKLEAITKLDWLPADLPTLASLGMVLAIAVIGLQYKQQSNAPEIKSLAWFMANPQDALSTNKICFDNPKLKMTENCMNSLHALEVMHKGPNS
jgi:hypothetical protein